MPGDVSAYAAIAIMAAVTFATRFAGAEIMRLLTLSPAVDRFLNAMASSVLAAIVATFVAQGGLREASAIAVAAVVMMSVRSAVLALVTGAGLAAAWTAVAGLS